MGNLMGQNGKQGYEPLASSWDFPPSVESFEWVFCLQLELDLDLVFDLPP